MNAPNHSSLIVFVKAPVMGAVKTRLAKGIGLVAATAWNRRSLIRTLTMLQAARLGFVIAAAPSAFALHHASAVRGRIVSQAGGDLGRRMAQAARTGGPCVIVGADIPGLSPAILRAALDAVQRFDLVLGPARDGGYYLVGVKSPAHVFRLYDKVRWSSEHALNDTLANAPAHWRIGFLPMLSDVDVAEDLTLPPQSSSRRRCSSSRGMISTKLQGR
ncbi:MAG: TIGR04282 family arsenosugar biosynthesis glycosyltransferase [Alphaproteobacteria bacterium]|nr:TIGR04282 family arsenosugar biosynthesis glycosyltransferase [Alphaproteobacteria bacterium]MDE2073024.1 TIGR04282 family arsenosugar biosynthesis glycosyltransferase [Alphaproteobacteria bacterium]MDE2350433.1 TIGR04282 family arsenosugar biosynthesis glycosyltransferase [Alphaproteobacteria bacterium]